MCNKKCELCKEKDSIIIFGIKGKEINFKAEVCEECLMSVAAQFFGKVGEE